MRINNIKGVTLIDAGLAGIEGEGEFLGDEASGGLLGSGKNSVKVRVEMLSKYLDEPVDFLKLNIEGKEIAVMEEVANSGKLCNVQELVIEYHGWPNKDQRLGYLLRILDHQGFRYLVHDYDFETGRASKPPFHWTPRTTWYCLVYGRRVDK
jgi:hypothetical protein